MGGLHGMAGYGADWDGIANWGIDITCDLIVVSVNTFQF